MSDVGEGFDRGAEAAASLVSSRIAARLIAWLNPDQPNWRKRPPASDVLTPASKFIACSSP